MIHSVIFSCIIARGACEQSFTGAARFDRAAVYSCSPTDAWALRPDVRGVQIAQGLKVYMLRWKVSPKKRGDFYSVQTNLREGTSVPVECDQAPAPEVRVIESQEWIIL